MTTFTGTSKKDTFIGGSEDDLFVFGTRNLSASDTLQDHGGLNALALVNSTSQSWQAIKASQWLGLSSLSAITLVSYSFGFDLSFDNNLYSANEVLATGELPIPQPFEESLAPAIPNPESIGDVDHRS